MKSLKDLAFRDEIARVARPPALRGPLIAAGVGSAGAGILLARWVSRFGPEYAAIALVIPFTVGLLPALAFGRRERDVAVPMPIATAVAAFGIGVVVGAPILLAVLVAARKIGP